MPFPATKPDIDSVVPASSLPKALVGRVALLCTAPYRIGRSGSFGSLLGMEGLLAGSGGKNHLTDSSLPLSLRRYCQSFTPLPIIGRVAKPIVSDQTLFEPRLGIFFGVSIFFAPRQVFMK